MPNPDTIAAISTPPGRGGIGIVRLSGPDALTIAAQLIDPGVKLEHAHARRARILDPQNPANTLDDALVTVFHAPRSYTGDTLVEIAAHGAPIVLETVLRAALAHGARLGLPVRLAEPGEFTQRAFLAGRLDLTQAEAVHDLIAAQTLDQARVAAQQLGGALARQIAAPKGALLHLIALLEAGMDFASGELDDVDLVPPSAIAASIAEAHAPLAALAATFRRGQLLRNGAAIALIGPPNAGKSSLFNRLLERDRAIVTPIPGTTRDTLEETLSLAGIPLRLIDTAGLRDLGDLGDLAGDEPSPGGPFIAGPYPAMRGEPQNPAIDAAEALGIARTRETLADADLVLLIHDATQPYTPAERNLAASIAGRPHILIHNKTDLLPAGTPGTGTSAGTSAGAGAGAPHLASEMWAPTNVTSATPIPTSALTGYGLDTLRAAILRALHAEGALAETALLNNLRQHEHLTAALTALDAASAANAAQLPHEVLLLDLHAALRSLDALTGTTTTDDILARIFSAFCIGK
jgi:tRNA modification GTPase